MVQMSVKEDGWKVDVILNASEKDVHVVVNGISILVITTSPILANSVTIYTPNTTIYDYSVNERTPLKEGKEKI